VIPVACPCGKVIQASDMFAGKRVKCPACGQPVTVPAAGAPPAPAALPSPVDDLLGPDPVQRVAAPAPVEEQGDPAFSPRPSRRTAPSSDEPAPVRIHLHLPFTSMSGLCLLIAFFLPWMKVSCSNMVIAEPTGLNLAANTEDSAMKALQERTKAGLKDNPYAKSATGKEEEKKEGAPWGNTSPELFLFPVLGVALAGWGLYRLKNPAEDLRGETTKLMVVVLLAGAMLFIERHRSYRKKALIEMKEAIAEASQKAATQPKPAVAKPAAPDFSGLEKEMKDAVKIEEGTGFWLSAIALAAAAIGMGAWLLRPGAGTE
jgi:hypothetical protein